jgi:hypothetical protein
VTLIFCSRSVVAIKRPLGDTVTEVSKEQKWPSKMKGVAEASALLLVPARLLPARTSPNLSAARTHSPSGEKVTALIFLGPLLQRFKEGGISIIYPLTIGTATSALRRERGHAEKQ